MRIVVASSGSTDVEISRAALPGTQVVKLAIFELPGGLGAHKWRDRRLLDELAARHPGAVPLLLDTDGTVLEAAHANVWIVEGDSLITSPADGRILPGVTRASVLAAEPSAREEPFDLDRLRSADAIRLTSALRPWHAGELLEGPG